MATYTVERSTHQTLAASTVDTVTVNMTPFKGQLCIVKIVNRATTPAIYFRASPGTPTVDGAESLVVQPGESETIQAVAPVTINLIASASAAYSVEGVSFGFTPADIADLRLWMSATSASSPVGTWVDKTVNSTAFTQSTEASKPIVYPGIANGYPILRWDGVDDSLRVAGTVSTATAGTVVMVFAVTDVVNNLTLLASADETGSDRYLLVRVNAGQVGVVQTEADTADSVRGSTVISANTYYVATVLSTGTAYQIYLNGTAETLVVVGGANTGDWLGDTTLRDSMTLGVLKRSTEVDYFAGDVAEVLLYDRALTTTERQALERDLGAKYGITVA